MVNFFFTRSLIIFLVQLSICSVLMLSGDISFRYVNYLKNQGHTDGRRSSVTVLDINQAMLDVGQLRAKRYYGSCHFYYESVINCSA